MHKLIGSLIEVYLKDDNDPLIGLLVSVESGEIYIKANIGSKVIIIPRQNISYYVTDKIPSNTSKIIDDLVKTNIEMPAKQIVSPSSINETASAVNSCIRVVANDCVVCNIPVPPTFKLDVWHDDIMKVVLGNPDVKSIMTGVVIKSTEYYPPDYHGHACVNFQLDVESLPTSEEQFVQDNTFSMGGNPMTDYLSPAQMAARMTGSIGGKKNG